MYIRRQSKGDNPNFNGRDTYRSLVRILFCVFMPGKRYLVREEPSLSADAVARGPVEWSSNRKPSFGGECSTRKISMSPEAPASIDHIIRHIYYRSPGTLHSRQTGPEQLK